MGAPRILAAAALLLLQVPLAAQMARIDVVSSDNKVGMVFADASEGVSVVQALWLGDLNKDKRLSAETAVVPQEWAERSFTFTPKATGALQIELMGPSEAERPWMEFAALSAQGATLQNSDFSRRDAKGLPEGWRLAGQATALKAGVKVNHDNRASQSVAVEAGKPVTITFKAREEQTEKQTKKPETEKQMNR